MTINDPSELREHLKKTDMSERDINVLVAVAALVNSCENPTELINAINRIEQAYCSAVTTASRAMYDVVKEVEGKYEAKKTVENFVEAVESDFTRNVRELPSRYFEGELGVKLWGDKSHNESLVEELLSEHFGNDTEVN